MMTARIHKTAGTSAKTGSNSSELPSFLRKLLRWDWFTPILRSGEKKEMTLDLGIFGLYRIMSTNKRLIIVKRFPKNLIETEYENIEFAEYYTNVEWLIGFYAAGLVVLSVLFAINHALIMDKLFQSAPFLQPFLGSILIWKISIGAGLLFAGLLIAGLYYAGQFVISLFGRLRILLYEQPPVDIICEMSRGLQNFIQMIEERNPPRTQKTIIKNVYVPKKHRKNLTK
ncbi:hypothetical protein HYU19_03735 [Candidatus Woesearchaeota archaeon]|nr:hypothetical protein [Candidatus Woesearchaeota archaeon]